MASDHVKAAMGVIALKLAGIAQLLPKTYKLTLVCRHVDNPKAHMVIGDDEAPAIRQVLLDLDNDVQAFEVSGSEAAQALQRHHCRECPDDVASDYNSR